MRARRSKKDFRSLSSWKMSLRSIPRAPVKCALLSFGISPGRHYMLQKAGGIKSGLAGHDLFIKNICGQIKLLYRILKCI